jgi:antitoxin PrlF
MALATMTSKGQITIPKEIRDEAGLKAGVEVLFRYRDDGVIELVPRTGDIMSLFGCLHSKVKGVTVEDMNETIRKMGSRK